MARVICGFSIKRAGGGPGRILMVGSEGPPVAKGDSGPGRVPSANLWSSRGPGASMDRKTRLGDLSMAEAGPLPGLQIFYQSMVDKPRFLPGGRVHTWVGLVGGLRAVAVLSAWVKSRLEAEFLCPGSPPPSAARGLLANVEVRASSSLQRACLHARSMRQCAAGLAWPDALVLPLPSTPRGVRAPRSGDWG